jgi:hypothetical protein
MEQCNFNNCNMFAYSLHLCKKHYTIHNVYTNEQNKINEINSRYDKIIASLNSRIEQQKKVMRKSMKKPWWKQIIHNLNKKYN